MFLNHQVRDGKLGFPFVHAANGKHTEIIEQAHEIIGIGDTGRGETFFQFTSNEALAHEGLDDGGIMGKLLVLADEHAQLFVVDTNVVFYHIEWRFAIVNVVLDEIEHHVGVVHRGFTIAFLREAVVIIPWLHHLYQFVYTMLERTVCGIIGQHLAHFPLCESHHLVKFRREGVVGAYIEAAGEVVHRHGTYSCDKTALDAGIGSRLHLVEEGAQVTFAVRLIGVTVQAFGVSENSICEVVVLIDKEIHLLSGTLASLIKVI